MTASKMKEENQAIRDEAEADLSGFFILEKHKNFVSREWYILDYVVSS